MVTIYAVPIVDITLLCSALQPMNAIAQFGVNAFDWSRRCELIITAMPLDCPLPPPTLSVVAHITAEKW